MTRLTRPAAIFLLVAAFTLPALADKAKSLYKQGQDAEARQNYEQAYDDYKQAYDLKPKDLLYRTAFEHLRFLAGASHVHRGQLLREAGKLEEALGEFQKAAEIDPSSPIAQQEIRRTQRLMDEAKSPVPRAAGRPANSLQKRVENAAGPAELAPISNVPITLKATEDTKRLYETVGKLAGINVLFDPDYTSRRIAIELNGVSLEEALEIISLESKTFWRAVTPNTIFVAADNPAKRKEIEQSVIKTFYLSNLSQTTELQEVVNTLRMILEISKIQPLPSQSAIVVRGTPDQIALAGKLVDDLDKAKPEVIVDLAIMQVSRDKIRNLGVNPPTSISVALQNNVNQNSNSNSNSNGTASTPATTSDTGINLNRLGNLNATDFTVTIPAASATAMFSDSDVKLLQNPQIRAVDGQKGSLKIGDRVPVATGSFQPGIGGVGINPLVNTQFQYLDVGVNIDITPRVHSNGEITLKVSMEISSVTSHVSIGGIDQPVIGQRKIEHEIRLREGEVNLLGGMLEDDDIKSLSGIPGLAKIPILKYLFSQSNVERRQNEIVFVMVPHIVRGQDLTNMNQSVISVGTSNSIGLRTVSSPPAASTAPGASAPVNPAPSAAATQSPAPAAATPPQAQTRTPVTPMPASAAGGTFVFDPPSITQPNGSTFTVSVLMNGTSNVYSVPLQLSYDPKALQVVNVSNGSLLSQDGQAVALVHRDDDTTGTLQVTATRPPSSGGVSGSGSVVVLTLQAKAPGQSMLVISQGGARDPGMNPIPVSGATAAITVQ